MFSTAETFDWLGPFEAVEHAIPVHDDADL